jgi:hypothetical protein
MATIPFRERGQSRCHGPGASSRSACLDSAPPAAIARAGASPQPIRLGHLLSRLAASAGWSCLRRGDSFRSLLARARLASIWLLRARSPPPGAMARSLAVAVPCSETGPPHTHPREGERDPLHPRCLPSSDSPCRGSPCPPQAVPSLWSNEAGAFFVPPAARAFDEASGSARTRSCAERDRLQEPGAPPLRPQRLQTTSTFGSVRG